MPRLYNTPASGGTVEATPVKHDTPVSVWAQAACFDTNLWQQHISGGNMPATEEAARVS